MKITVADCFLVLCVAQCSICALSHYAIDSGVESTISIFKSGSPHYAIFSIGEDTISITTEKEGTPTSWEAFVSDLTNDTARKIPCAYGLIRMFAEFSHVTGRRDSYYVYVSWFPDTFRSEEDTFYCTVFSDSLLKHLEDGGIHPRIKQRAVTAADLPREVAIPFMQ